MELKQLETFLVVARHLHFTRAARELGYVQSSVTAHVKALEAELGVALFERLGRRVVLTDSGRELCAHARVLLGQAEQAREAVRGAGEDPDQVRGTLRIAAPESLCAHHLPPVLRAVRERFPLLRLAFQPAARGPLLDALAEGTIDAGFLQEEAVREAGVHAERLLREPLRLVAAPGHRLGGYARVETGDLARETVLLMEPGVRPTGPDGAGVEPGRATPSDGGVLQPGGAAPVRRRGARGRPGPGGLRGRGDRARRADRAGMGVRTGAGRVLRTAQGPASDARRTGTGVAGAAGVGRTGLSPGRRGRGRGTGRGRRYGVGMEIWVNPACSKCRGAVTLLDEEGARYTVRRYLEDPPDEDELRAVLGRLGLEPWDITRTGEQVARDLGLKEWPRGAESRDRWIAALAEHPRLIQRPIITADDGTAVVARTDEAVRDALGRRE